jgi:hypothetical protein
MSLPLIREQCLHHVVMPEPPRRLRHLSEGFLAAADAE